MEMNGQLDATTVLTSEYCPRTHWIWCYGWTTESV